MAAEADSELVDRSIERKDTKPSQLKGPTILQFLIATLAFALLAIVILFVQSAMSPWTSQTGTCRLIGSQRQTVVLL
jgi:hypothetical protein